MVPSLASTGNNSSMSLKEVKRTAAVAWSPPLQTNPLLATGTLAGALDASFSTNAELEIHDLQLEDKGHGTLSTKTSITCPSRYVCCPRVERAQFAYCHVFVRFNRLAWSAHASSSSDGVIVGGCEDGTVSFWSASDLLSQPNNEAALIARCEAHQGPVRGLQVNPFQPFLVASGATDAEVTTLVGRKCHIIGPCHVDLAVGPEQPATALFALGQQKQQARGHYGSGLESHRPTYPGHRLQLGSDGGVGPEESKGGPSADHSRTAHRHVGHCLEPGERHAAAGGL